MGLVSFFRSWLGFDEDVKTINLTKYRAEAEAINAAAYALFTAIETMAALAANCEYKTYYNGKEQKGLEWARLNFAPNINQSATDFWIEFYTKVLSEDHVLVFPYQDQLIIADYFQITERALNEHTFTNVTRGDFTYNRVFKNSEVIYFEYPIEAAKALRYGLLDRYNKLISCAAEDYENKGGNKVILDIPNAAVGTEKDKKKYDMLMNEHFRKFFKFRNAVLPLHGGITASTLSTNTTESGDFTKLLNDAVTKAALAYRLAPALVTGEVAGIKEAIDWTLTVGIDPLVNAAAELFTARQFSRKQISEGNRIVADTSNIKHIDIFGIASNADKLIASGMLSVDEVRYQAGLQPTGEEWAQKHYITKNYQKVDSLDNNDTTTEKEDK